MKALGCVLLPLLLTGCAANTCPLAHDVGLECSGNLWHVEGIPNLGRVRWPGRPDIFRGGQLEGAEQWQALARIGVTKVLKLNGRDEGSDDGAAEVGIQVYHVPIPPYTTQWLSVSDEPNPAAMREIRGLIEQMGAEETFTCRPGYGEGRCAPQFQRNVWYIHCKNGHDRTGLAVMLVRVLVDGWDPLQAYAEALQWGYHPQISGLDRARRRWVRSTP